MWHSIMELDPVTQTPCPEGPGQGSEPHASNGPRIGAGHFAMVRCPAEPEPPAHGPEHIALNR